DDVSCPCDRELQTPEPGHRDSAFLLRTLTIASKLSTRGRGETGTRGGLKVLRVSASPLPRVGRFSEFPTASPTSKTRRTTAIHRPSGRECRLGILLPGPRSGRIARRAAARSRGRPTGVRGERDLPPPSGHSGRAFPDSDRKSGRCDG